nr:hypothetical protein [Tanacetum cinerariifolium]
MTSLTNSNLELKNMFGQFIKINTASSSGSGTLPSNTITNPKEDLKGITPRSGTAYPGPTIPTTSSSSPKVVKRMTEVTKDTVPPTNNESTKDVQPLVVKTETSVLNSEPVVAPIIEPVVASGNNQGRNQFFQGDSHGQNPPPAYEASAYQAPGYQDPVHQASIPQPKVMTTTDFTNYIKENDAILKNVQTNMNSLTNSNLELKNMFALVQQASIPQLQVVTTTEFTNYMKANNAILKNMQTNMTSLTNSNLKLKNMFGQFMKMNTASSLGLRTLPSNTITNLNEDLKGITTRSGNAYKGPTIPTTSSLSKVVERETKVTKDMVPPTNNGRTKDVQPPVVQIETPISNYEPVVALAVEPVVAPNILENVPPPNNNPNVPKEEPILDQAPATLVRFVPQWIDGQIPDNNNGWLEEDLEEEPEEEEIEDEDMVNDEEDDTEVINPYEEADPHNQPPPTSDEETEFAPPVVQIADADEVPIPPVIQFGSNFYVRESSATRDLLAGNSKVYAPGLMYRTEKKMAKKLRQDELCMNGQEFDITALDSAEEPFIYTAPVLRADDPYVMVKDAAMDTRGDEDVDTDAPLYTQPSELCGLTHNSTVGLVRWFKKMENTFEISECAEGKNVKFATATLHGRALTWWNSQVSTLGSSEVGDELRHLKLRDMNIAAYMEMFNELALMCLDDVPNEKKKVELYIKGLPEITKSDTTLSRHVTLKEAVCMTHALMEQKIQAKNERIAEGLKRKWENNNNNNKNSHNRGNYRNNNHHNQNNNRRQGNARALTTTQNKGANQTRIAPKCNRCGRCHFDQFLLKCENCGRMRHKAKDCRSKNLASGATIHSNIVCYECGERG